MKKGITAAVAAGMGMLVPVWTFAQSGGLASDIKGLQGELDTVYNDMMPLFGKLIGVGQGIAGFAATWYIAYRVWRHIANAEPIDFYPLLRPFVIGFAILIWPSTIALLNAVLGPTVSGTSQMVKDSDAAIAKLLKEKDEAVKNSAFYKMYVGPDGSGDRDKWYAYTHPDDPNDEDEGFFSSIGNDIKFTMAKLSYNFRNAVKQWLSDILQVFYEAAALCINTIRTFYLIVLAIVGPIAFGLSVFDGLQHTLINWVARYINIFLWLPVANIFGSIIGKIQQKMIELDINQIKASGDTYFGATDTAYLIFLIIGIIGYFTIPSVANYIIHAGGDHGHLRKTTGMFGSATQATISTIEKGSSMTGQPFAGGGMGNLGGYNNWADLGKKSHSRDAGTDGYMANRLSGRTDGNT